MWPAKELPSLSQRGKKSWAGGIRCPPGAALRTVGNQPPLFGAERLFSNSQPGAKETGISESSDPQAAVGVGDAICTADPTLVSAFSPAATPTPGSGKLAPVHLRHVHSAESTLASEAGGWLPGANKQLLPIFSGKEPISTCGVRERGRAAKTLGYVGDRWGSQQRARRLPSGEGQC